MEVLIAIAILSLILSASFAMANRTSRATQQASERGEASKSAQSQIEMLQQYLNGLGSTDVVSQFFCLDINADEVSIPSIASVSDIEQKYNNSDVKGVCGHGPDNRYVTIIEKLSDPTDQYKNNTYIVHTRWDSLGSSRTDKIDLVHRVYKQVGASSTSGGGASATPINITANSPYLGTIKFSDNFEDGNLNKWDYEACPNGATIVTSPVRSGSHSAKFTVDDNQNPHTELNPVCNGVLERKARAQLVSRPPGTFSNNDDYYFGFSVFFPDTFPATLPSDPFFFQFAEIYGPPFGTPNGQPNPFGFGGSPTMDFGVKGSNLVFKRHYQKTPGVQDWDEPWTSSGFSRNTWQDFVVHVKFSDSLTGGFVEIWHNRNKVTFKDGSQKLIYQTLFPTVSWNSPSGINTFMINQYRGTSGTGPITMVGPLTIYHDDIRVGDTYDVVAR